jgi:hypothetical protein
MKELLHFIIFNGYNTRNMGGFNIIHPFSSKELLNQVLLSKTQKAYTSVIPFVLTFYKRRAIIKPGELMIRQQIFLFVLLHCSIFSYSPLVTAIAGKLVVPAVLSIASQQEADANILKGKWDGSCASIGFKLLPDSKELLQAWKSGKIQKSDLAHIQKLLLKVGFHPSKFQEEFAEEIAAELERNEILDFQLSSIEGGLAASLTISGRTAKKWIPGVPMLAFLADDTNLQLHATFRADFQGTMVVFQIFSVKFQGMDVTQIVQKFAESKLSRNIPELQQLPQPLTIEPIYQDGYTEIRVSAGVQ